MVSQHSDDVLATGAWGRVRFATDAAGRQPVRAFLESLRDSDRKKVMNILIALADDGTVHNREKFRKERGKIFAVKSHQIRIAAFQEGRDWILAHGLTKKQNEWRAADLDRADRVRIEHLSRGSP